MDSAFTEKIFGEIMSVDTISVTHDGAGKGLDRCAQYLNITYRLLDALTRQLGANPCPLMCDKIEKVNEKVTVIGAMQQELFAAYLKGWEDPGTVEIMTAQGCDLEATKQSTQTLQQSWYQKTMKMTTDMAMPTMTTMMMVMTETAKYMLCWVGISALRAKRLLCWLWVSGLLAKNIFHGFCVSG